MTLAPFLRNVPVLAGLSEDLLERLAGQARERHVRAGGWVMREGEEAESLYIVRSGRLDVVDEGPPEALIRLLRRGDVVGELALLRRGTRSASVRARRDAELVELSRAAFEGLIEEAPSFALGLTRALGAQLAASRTPLATATPPQAIAVVGVDAGAPVEQIADELGRALSAHGSLALLTEGDVAAIDRAERDAERVLLRGSSDQDDPWTALCVREADVVIAASAGGLDAAWRARATALDGCELLVLAPHAAGDVAALRPRALQVIADPARRPRAIEALARRLAGRSLGIVLSGGGARALAHLGVVEELRAAGLVFDRVAGVSFGGLVAAALAMDLDSDAVHDVFARAMAAGPTRDFVPPAYALIRGGRARRLLREAFGERLIEELPLRFFCVSCDLVAREPVVHRSGPLVDAVYASLAIPAVFPPVATADGRLLVDGGVLDNLPVETMARDGEGPIVAVDVSGRGVAFQRRQRPGVARLGGPARRMLTGSEAEIPRLGETIVRSVTVGSIDTVAAARLHADLVIAPPVESVGLMEWGAIGRMRELGRQAARDALRSHEKVARELGIEDTRLTG